MEGLNNEVVSILLQYDKLVEGWLPVNMFLIYIWIVLPLHFTENCIALF